MDVEKLGGEEGELFFWASRPKFSFYIQFLRCHASRNKSGVARLCSMMVQMVSFRVVWAWLRQSRKILILQSRPPHNKWHSKLLFTHYRKTLNAIFTGN
jgi:hypothetical protein